MRIGQLARRLGIPPSDILQYVGNQNIDSEAGTNSRLSKDDVVKVITHFAPEKLSEILTAPAEETVVVEAVQPVEVVEEEVVIEKIGPIEETPVAEVTPVTEETSSAPVEVIRVSKVELQGLKVLGKIDLPQKKKAEATPTEQTEGESTSEQNTSQEQTPAQKRPYEQRPRREYQKRNDQPREWKNPLEAKRQQEAREAEKKKQEQLERQKEKRASHYYSKVKSVPTKAVRRIEEQTVVEDIETKEAPKGLIGRFLHWLKN